MFVYYVGIRNSYVDGVSLLQIAKYFDRVNIEVHEFMVSLAKTKQTHTHTHTCTHTYILTASS